MTLDEARAAIGRRVAFTYLHGEQVFGRITSVGERNVFVRFEKSSSEACDPEQLWLLPVDLEVGAWAVHEVMPAAMVCVGYLKVVVAAAKSLGCWDEIDAEVHARLGEFDGDPLDNWQRVIEK